jgi:hypothetical protein
MTNWKMLFQLKAEGDGEGDAARTIVDGDSTHAEEDAEAQPQNNPQWENAEGANENDKTEV